MTINMLYWPSCGKKIITIIMASKICDMTHSYGAFSHKLSHRHLTWWQLVM